jgi:hypothetical protein
MNVRNVRYLRKVLLKASKQKRDKKKPQIGRKAIASDIEIKEPKLYIRDT